MLEGPGEEGSCTVWGETMLGRVVLLLLSNALQVEAIFLVAIQSFLNIVFKARQAAEKTGSHCSRVLCLWQDQCGSGRNRRIAEARSMSVCADESDNIQLRLSLQNAKTNAKETGPEKP